MNSVPEERRHYFDEANEEDLIPEVVDDELHDPRAHIYSDEELEFVIKEILRNSSVMDASDITVTVHNCDVRLAGSVKGQEERDYAEKLVKLVHGVGEVQSDIVVKLNEGILPTDIGRNP